MVGEEKESVARRKKYHRRSPVACDECRLRKKKCDGGQPTCASCKEISHVCTYQFRRPARPPTQRIRDLEEHLRYAQNFIRALQTKVSDIDDVDFESVLGVLDFSLPASLSSPIEKESKMKLASMMTGHNHMVHDGPWSCSFFGHSSGFALVMRTLELFQKDIDQVEPNSRAVASLFDNPIPDTNEQPRLPSQELALQLVATVFARCPFIHFLREDSLKEDIKIAYNTMKHDNFPPLFHMVLALGYIYDNALHQEIGCDNAAAEATKHYLSGRRLIDLCCKDVISLQAIVASILFLISTSRIVSAHALIGVACSTVLRLGLHTGSSVGNAAADETRANLFSAVLSVDAYASLVLGLPPLLNIPNLYNSVVLTRDGGESEAFVRVTELLRLTTLARESVFNQIDVDIRQLANVERDLHNWANDASRRFDSLGAVLKHEMESTYLLVQIALYMPFLHYLRVMAAGAAISLNQSQHALACLKVASSTILKTEAVMNSGAFCPTSWKSVYAVFLAVMSLVFLIAAHNGTSQPSEAWKRAMTGIKVLAACRCCGNGANACLNILKMVVRRLQHTVDFDIEQIEASTPRLCQRKIMEAFLRPEHEVVTPGSTASFLSHILHQEERPSDADKILKEAEAIDLESIA